MCPLTPEPLQVTCSPAPLLTPATLVRRPAGQRGSRPPVLCRPPHSPHSPHSTRYSLSSMSILHTDNAIKYFIRELHWSEPPRLFRDLLSNLSVSVLFTALHSTVQNILYAALWAKNLGICISEGQLTSAVVAIRHIPLDKFPWGSPTMSEGSVCRWCPWWPHCAAERPPVSCAGGSAQRGPPAGTGLEKLRRGSRCGPAAAE